MHSKNHVNWFSMQMTHFFLSAMNVSILERISQLETNAANLVDYFERHRVNLNESQTEFIVFCKRSKTQFYKKT